MAASMICTCRHINLVHLFLTWRCESCGCKRFSPQGTIALRMRLRGIAQNMDMNGHFIAGIDPDTIRRVLYDAADALQTADEMKALAKELR
jgi:hypothetical protein